MKMNTSLFSDNETSPVMKSVGQAVSKLSTFLDIKNACGYITLLNLDLPQSHLEVNSSFLPRESRKMESSNGDLSAEKANLLSSELDSLDEEMGEKKAKMTLDLKTGEDEVKREANWIILDLNFGVPLFDPDLNQQICTRIIDHGLWKPER